mmetsp:Transcript_29146/g.82169  ORF Transcript_29146/g.82169 Transcript_29146/m.82169 type:complete len:600 (+) Transcript_29146:92-1891(+)|eukprot:CAMPEP_0117682780 /NCGR_PEP_ID=MMETSP0804-20121206/19909_1 /TAXON_ID=1074897 /ORGANISM="Tetraselmis astigmatica, Strain CCMP880" /LENGTH=599 /DNA_ID=CAMNT_0005493049 /DNA_START=11 /DNA_END=1810 /DNA_ORIENTATION=-
MASRPVVRALGQSAVRQAAALSRALSKPKLARGISRVASSVRQYESSSRPRTLRVSCNSQPTKRDYAASAADKVILRLPPGHQLSPDDVKRVFDYPGNLTDKYELKEKIGAGSFGTVVKAIDKATGIAYACKSIGKIPNKQTFTTPHHLLKIRSEVDCMLTLGASLDAVFLRDTFEDEHYIHLIMELCTGGPLIQSMDVSQLSEKRVAGLIRSILRFLAQCHSKGLIYRDVKPGNFLYGSKDPNSPLKATDFGLMIQHSEKEPPLTTRAGTPVYLAPEVINRSYSSPADLYSVGVLCFQLLTGRFPYWPSNKFKAPTMNELFDLISTSIIDFSKLPSEGVSPAAQDLIEKLLEKDPSKRITAAEALNHPWIQEDGAASSAPLNGTVVQRLQRFAVNGHLKQFVLNKIAEDIMAGNGVVGADESKAFFEPLKEMFATVDTDNSGDVSVEELVDGLIEQGYSLEQAEVEQLITRMDVDRNGRIEFDEFATCLLDWQVFREGERWKELVKRAFSNLDLNNDGYISLEEIVAVLPEVYKTEQEKKAAAMAMMREFDSSTDGLISWEEFYQMLSDVSSQHALEYYDRRFTSTAINDSETEIMLN